MQHNLKEKPRALGRRSSLENVGSISHCPAPSPTASWKGCAHRLSMQPWLGTSCSQLGKGGGSDTTGIPTEKLPPPVVMGQPPSFPELCQAS